MDKKEDQHLVTVNGIVHVVFNEILTSANKDRMFERFRNFDAIPTTIKEMKIGLFGARYIVTTVLVPEYFALSYSKS